MLFHKLTDQKNIPLKLSSIQLNGKIIERENSFKFLGVILDEHLKLGKNIYNVLKIRSQQMLVFFIKQVN